MNDTVIDALIIFLIIGFFIYLKGFQSNLDFLSITIIYVIFSGCLIGIFLVATGFINLMDWFLDYVRKKFIKGYNY